MRRLKFQYLENNAKDKYVKTIVNDEAPMITADTNADLQAANSVKKEKLKSAKTRLAERHSSIRKLAPLVENGEVHFQSDWRNLTEERRFPQSQRADGGSCCTDTKHSRCQTRHHAPTRDSPVPSLDHPRRRGDPFLADR
jgi:hypothetical protein